jgi:hypothetical protein
MATLKQQPTKFRKRGAPKKMMKGAQKFGTGSVSSRKFSDSPKRGSATRRKSGASSFNRGGTRAVKRQFNNSPKANLKRTSRKKGF